MSFVNWVIDSLASEDVIDLYFVLSDLVDIDLSPEQIAEQGIGDALSQSNPSGFRCNSRGEIYLESDVDFGKQVY